MKKKISKYKYTIAIMLGLSCFSGCKKFIEVKGPINTVNADNVYANDATAIQVLTGLYTNFSLDDYTLRDTRSGLPQMSYYPGMSADELTLYNGATVQELINYYQNSVKANNLNATDFWTRIYKYVFVANSAIEGLTKSTTLTPAVKTHLLGEACFVRAFCYFYLLNLYGEVPIVLSTDYSVSGQQARDSKQNVYKQIVADLLKAENSLTENFVDGSVLNTTDERTRPNKFAATALLARVYLYIGDWADAITESSKIISANSQYDLTPLNEVFLKNSKETIWALQTVTGDVHSNTGDGLLFLIPDYGPTDQNPVHLSVQQLESFEPGDQRFDNWVNKVEIDTNTYYFPFKYKIGEVATDPAEYTIVLRLSEQYLIRAEAKIQQGDIAGGIADLNAVRTRATDLSVPLSVRLPQLSSGLNKEEALKAAIHERQVELFTEWGHRWLDLKRTGTVNEVMNPVTQFKGGVWNSNASLYPIPLKEIQTNTKLVQNPGY